MRTLISLLFFSWGLTALLTAEERVVALGGPVTEIVFALGAGESVVAVDQSSLYPEAATERPQVGYVGAIGTEGILAMNPTLILATDRLGPPAARQQLENSGIPLKIISNPNTAESLKKAVLELGDALNRGAEAEALWTDIAAGLAAVQPLAAESGDPRVAFLMGNNGIPLAAGRDTQADGMIQLAGGSNVFQEYNGYKPVSEEALISADLDVILVASHRAPEDADPRDRLRDLGLTSLARSTGSKVLLVDLSYYLSFGPRTGQAALDLARRINEAPSS